MSAAPTFVYHPLALFALASCVLTIGCSKADQSAIRAPEYEGSPIVTPTGTLKLVLAPTKPVFRRRSAILIHYHLENIGDSAQHYRDIPEFYYFNLLDPDGLRQLPVANSEIFGAGSHDSVALEPGRAGPHHVVNLACMDYHPLDFTPRFQRTEPSGCMLEYRLRKPGRYKVIGQFIPPGPMPEYGFAGRLPSVPDTVEFEYWPWWQFWR
jgi:hypothetical protein